MNITESEFINQFKPSKDIGLLHGVMGICIYQYLLGRETELKEYTDIADELLDEIYSQVSKNIPFNFEFGLAGIGWGIEFLTQNEFVEADTDEVLGDIDKAVLKSITSDSPLDMSMANGLTGYLLYLIKRLQSKDQLKNTITTELNKELLILVINKLEQCYNKYFTSISKDICFDLFSGFPIQINALSQAYELGIYNSKIERILVQLLPSFETSMPSMHTNRLTLACELKYLHAQIPNQRLERLIDILLYTVDFDQLLNEISDETIGVRNGLAGLKYILWKLLKILPVESPYYMKVTQTLKSFPEINEKFPDDEKLVTPQTLSLGEGIIGVKIMNLLLEQKEPITLSKEVVLT